MQSFLFSLALFVASLAQANEVLIQGTVVVEAELLHQLVCSSDKKIKELIDKKEVQAIDEIAFYEYRFLVREQLMDMEGMPIHFYERQDYCSLASALLSVNKECDGISKERLELLKQDSCNAFIW
jgi:hypothetical protein